MFSILDRLFNAYLFKIKLKLIRLVTIILVFSVQCWLLLFHRLRTLVLQRLVLIILCLSQLKLFFDILNPLLHLFWVFLGPILIWVVFNWAHVTALLVILLDSCSHVLRILFGWVLLLHLDIVSYGTSFHLLEKVYFLLIKLFFSMLKYFFGFTDLLIFKFVHIWFDLGKFLLLFFNGFSVGWIYSLHKSFDLGHLFKFLLGHFFDYLLQRSLVVFLIVFEFHFDFSPLLLHLILHLLLIINHFVFIHEICTRAGAGVKVRKINGRSITTMQWVAFVNYWLIGLMTSFVWWQIKSITWTTSRHSWSILITFTLFNLDIIFFINERLVLSLEVGSSEVLELGQQCLQLRLFLILVHVFIYHHWLDASPMKLLIASIRHGIKVDHSTFIGSPPFLSFE